MLYFKGVVVRGVRACQNLEFGVYFKYVGCFVGYGWKRSKNQKNMKYIVAAYSYENIVR